LDNNVMKRRNFFKRLLGVTGAIIIPLKYLMGSSKVNQQIQNRRAGSQINEELRIMQMYGGEFGGIKPDSGRKNHVHI